MDRSRNKMKTIAFIAAWFRVTQGYGRLNKRKNKRVTKMKIAETVVSGACLVIIITALKIACGGDVVCYTFIKTACREQHDST